jgi:hypothetical protein
MAKISKNMPSLSFHQSTVGARMRNVWMCAMTDELVMTIPGTCDSYQVVREAWNRPNKLWIVYLSWVWQTNGDASFCAVYAGSSLGAAQSARDRYDESYIADNEGMYNGDAVQQLAFDENGVSNVWVW